jgi:DNA-binding SARP family transcriptional activator
VEFRILGPLEIIVDSERINLGGTRQHLAIATLLLGANQVVTTERLLEAIYGEDLPPTSRSQLQNSMSSLRRTLARYDGAPVIRTHPHGYVIAIDSEQLDSRRFAELVTAGRTALDAACPEDAVTRYREALRLWRGPALDGMDSQLIRAAASQLDEQRITVIEDCIDLELDLGRHRELVSELTELIEEYPLRDRLPGQLMLALYRCDRTAEALQAYRHARGRMISELGIEPDERLQRLEHAILRSDPSLALPARSAQVRPAAARVPSLLPADLGDFVGRAEQIDRIRQHLLGASGRLRAARAVPVVVISGKGGVGKTSLAVHVAHQLVPHFPDGQLFADLHGTTSHQIGPSQVLERFLRTLGVPGPEIPDGLDERAEVYRNLLGNRSVLVVLDNALTEGQVAPLLPGGGGAAGIVTSRNRLTGLAGAVHVGVDVFDPGTSLDLLAHIAGAARMRSQPSQARLAAEYCGHLPLALRIAGARLSARPHWSIEHLVDRLADEAHRLDELRYGDMSVRPTISLTYESASEEAKRLFRRLALLELPTFSGWLGAALHDQPLALAEDLLDELVNAQLIEITGTGSGGRSQYRFHDLIRVFARERLAADEPPGERAAALERAFGALLYLAEQAHSRLWGGEYARLPSDALRWPLPEPLVEQLIGDPVAWYDGERTTLVSAIQQAAQAGFTDLCWSLAYNAATLFETRTYYDDWHVTHDIALDATRKSHSVRGQAAILYSLGTLHLAQQRFDLARENSEAATRLFREAGDQQGLALVSSQVAYMDRLSGRLADAAKGYEEALAVFRRTSDPIAAAYVLHGLAQVKLELRQPDEARRLLSEALALSRALRPGRAEAQVLHRIGESYLLSGELEKAVDAFELALTRVRSQGDPIGESYALHGLGVAKIRQGQFGQARSALQGALDLAQTTYERLAEGRALLGLSELAQASGDSGEAIILGQHAAAVFRLMGAPLYEARAFVLIGEAYAASGDSEASAAAAAEAAVLRATLAEAGTSW